MFVYFAVPCVDAVIPDHFKVFFRDVLNEEADKVQSGNSSGNELLIFVAIIMISHKLTIIVIDTGCSNDRPAKIAADIFSNRFRVSKGWFGADIKAVFTILVNISLPFFEGIAKFLMEKV